MCTPDHALLLQVQSRETESKELLNDPLMCAEAFTKPPVKKGLLELLPMARAVVLCCWHPLCHDRSQGTLENLESIVHKVQMHKEYASTT